MKFEANRPLPLNQLLDRLHVPVIAVDANVTATCANRAAERILGRRGNLIQGRLVGEVIECVHAAAPGGCGRSIHCAGCAIRRMATATFRDGTARCSIEAEQSVRHDGKTGPTRFTISTQKLGDVVLVIVEDMKALSSDLPYLEQPADH
jgi:hypothetical protein